MTVFHLVQHADKERQPGDPGLTESGRRQAAITAEHLQKLGARAVFSSPLRRARETAQFIATSAGLHVQQDARLRERMNWDGFQPVDQFLKDWTVSVQDRDFVPTSGDSSHQAAARFRSCLTDLSNQRGPLAIVTHGGVAVDLLRTLLGDSAIPPELMQRGVPSCAITTLDGLSVMDIASVSHLA